MPKANFAENQLQQEISLSLYKYFFKLGQEIDIFIPSLLEEAHLGWDSAFAYPCYNQPSYNYKGYGVNFFIQYKLSEKLQTPKAKEWCEWKKPYFRFKLPHSPKNKGATNNKDDYHQYDILKKLANDGYSVFYVTNSVISLHELFAMRKTNTLLQNTPCLNVANITNYHKYVTFSDSSNYFKLHSEVEILKQYNLEQNLKEIYIKNNFIPFNESVNNLIKYLSEMERELERELVFDEKIRQISKPYKFDKRRNDFILIKQIFKNENYNYFYKYLIIKSFFKKHFGISMHWLPQ